jgi:hypothetical protein
LAEKALAAKRPARPKSSFALVISVAKSVDPSGVRSSKMTLKTGSQPRFRAKRYLA